MDGTLSPGPIGEIAGAAQNSEAARRRQRQVQVTRTRTRDSAGLRRRIAAVSLSVVGRSVGVGCALCQVIACDDRCAGGGLVVVLAGLAVKSGVEWALRAETGSGCARQEACDRLGRAD